MYIHTLCDMFYSSKFCQVPTGEQTGQYDQMATDDGVENGGDGLVTENITTGDGDLDTDGTGNITTGDGHLGTDDTENITTGDGHLGTDDTENILVNVTSLSAC